MPVPVPVPVPPVPVLEPEPEPEAPAAEAGAGLDELSVAAEEAIAVWLAAAAGGEAAEDLAAERLTKLPYRQVTIAAALSLVLSLSGCMAS